MLNTYGQLQFIAAYRKYGLEFLPLHLLAILAEYDIRNCQPPDRMTCLSLGLYYPIHIIYWLDICHFTLFIFFIVLIHFCNSITIIKIKSLSHYEQKPQLTGIFNSCILPQAPTLQLISIKMQESQQKRNQFRKEIRQKHINGLFQNIRKQHKERQNNSGTIVLTEEKKKDLRQKIEQFIYKSIINYQSKDYNALFKDIQAISKLVQTLSEAFSSCLNEQLMIHGTLVIDGNKKDVSKLVLQKLGSHVGTMVESNKIQEEVPIDTHLRIVDRLMDISCKIQYQKFGLQSAILVSKAIWNVFSSNYHLPIDPSKQEGKSQQKTPAQSDLRLKIFNNLCITLSNLLDSPNHITMKKHLQQLGLTKKLFQIIKISANFKTELHLSLLKLLYLYNSNDLTQDSEEISINGITITSAESTEKVKFVMYCIFCLRKNQPKLYELALLALNQIIEENPFFIDSIKTDYFGKILELVLAADRKTNVAALHLLCTFVFYSPSATDELVEDNSLLDFLFGRLAFERQIPAIEPYTKKSIQNCSNILCDILLTRNKRVKKMAFQHQIWEMLFQSLEENHKLFSTAFVFKFFFNAVPRKELFRFLPSYLQTVRYLPLENEAIPEIKEIKVTLLNIFGQSITHYPPEIHEETVRLFQTNNLLKVIEDFEAAETLQSQKQAFS